MSADSQRVRQNPEQIGAMNRDARRAEFLAIVALIAARDFASVPPRADDCEFRRIGRRIDLVLEAERTQRLDGVGRKSDAGADLGKLRRLLADDDLGALALERKRRRKPADPAADDQECAVSAAFAFPPQNSTTKLKQPCARRAHRVNCRASPTRDAWQRERTHFSAS